MAETTKQKTVVAPFEIEIDTPRNNDVMLQSIPGCRLRGAVYVGKVWTDPETGETTAFDNKRLFQNMPKIPGQRLSVHPAKCSYTVLDPLHDDEELCERIRKRVEEERMFSVGKTLGGVSPRDGNLDRDRMKTLCREVIWLLESDCAKMVSGPRPKLEDVNELPGDYLTNPGSRTPNNQPRYEKDMPEYEQMMAREGR